jgi:hypothetical protein
VEGQVVKIESTEFGSITIDGKTYPFDVVIRLSGEIIKRKKKLSKKCGPTVRRAQGNSGERP